MVKSTSIHTFRYTNTKNKATPVQKKRGPRSPRRAEDKRRYMVHIQASTHSKCIRQQHPYAFCILRFAFLAQSSRPHVQEHPTLGAQATKSKGKGNWKNTHNSSGIWIVQRQQASGIGIAAAQNSTAHVTDTQQICTSSHRHKTAKIKKNETLGSADHTTSTKAVLHQPTARVTHVETMAMARERRRKEHIYGWSKRQV